MFVLHEDDSIHIQVTHIHTGFRKHGTLKIDYNLKLARPSENIRVANNVIIFLLCPTHMLMEAHGAKSLLRISVATIILRY